MRSIDISFKTIFSVTALILTLLLLSRIVDVLVLIFLAFVLAAAIHPLVDQISRWMPRWLSVLLIFFAILAAMGGVLYLLIPPLVSQTQDLIRSFTTGTLRFSFEFFGYDVDSRAIVDQINLEQVTEHLSEIVATTKEFLVGVAGFITILVLALYTLLDERYLKQSVVNLVPAPYRETTIRVAREIGLKMGAWLRGQLALGLIVGVLSYIGLLAFGVNFALPLAVFAGVTELLPIIGPFLGGGAAVLVALTQDWTTALFIAIWYLAVQQIENHILVPQIMRKALGLSPVVVVIALLIGAKLYGLLGVVLSIPVASAISVLINEWPRISKAIGEGRKSHSKQVT